MTALRQFRIYLTQASDKLDFSQSAAQVHRHIPYFSQWESPEMMADFISGQRQASEDPLWAKSGATSTKHYQQWAQHCCGMACLKMILADCQHQIIPIIELAEASVDFGCYIKPLHQTVGLQYQPFQTYVKQKFGLTAHIARPLTIHRIIKALSQGRYVMASVAADIDLDKPQPSQTGHLVLITGYDQQAKTITFHNPSGRTESRRAHNQLTFNQFKNAFNYKGLIISHETTRP